MDKFPLIELFLKNLYDKFEFNFLNTVHENLKGDGGEGRVIEQVSSYIHEKML